MNLLTSKTRKEKKYTVAVQCDWWLNWICACGAGAGCGENFLGPGA